MQTTQVEATANRQPIRSLATVIVTLLATAALAFVGFNSRPTLAGEMGEAGVVSLPGFDIDATAARADASLPVAAEVFAESPPKNEDLSPSF